MKPISVRFKCFGPYMDEQYVNFEELNSKGIFLISGETGSGKTTILDAICYALFGKSSGGLRGEIEVMRCKSATPNNETLVEYIFSSNGKTYKFYRELRFGRKKLNEHNSCEVSRNGSFVPMFENPKKIIINKKAEEIIGLTYDQFCQVVILPQGKFEKLLVSNSEAKEEILTSLFHADRWDLIVKEIKEQVDSEKKRLDDEYKDIRSKLSVFECENLNELSNKIEKSQEEIKQKKDLLEQLKKEKDSKAKIFEAALKDDEIFKILDESKEKLKKLLSLKEDFEEKRNNLKLSENADLIKEIYTTYQGAEAAVENAEKDFNQAIKVAKKAEAENEKIAKEKQIHEENKENYEKDKIKLSKYEDAKQLYSDLVTKEKSCEQLKKEFEIKEQEKLDLEKELDNKNKEWNTAKNVNDEAIKYYTETSKHYTANIAGLLANDLKEGAPCPVCGSKDHPAPAQINCNIKISKEDVDNANKKIKATSSALAKCSKERENKEKELHDLKVFHDKAKTDYTTAKAEYDSANKNKFSGIDDLNQLKEIIVKTKKCISEYDKAKKRYDRQIKNSKRKICGSQTIIER